MRQAAARSGEAVKKLVRKHRPDYQIVVYIGVLLLLGLVVLYAISPARVELLNYGGDASLDQAHFMQRQLLYLIIGVAAFVVAAAVPFSLWRRYASFIVLGSLGLCVLLFIFGALNVPLALCTGGACRWFNLGFTTFQPAELVKFGILLFTAGFLARKMRAGKINDVHETLIPLGMLVGAASLFIIGLQKDMGTGLALLGIVATMLFVAGINKRTASLVFGAMVGLSVLFILIAPHRLERVMTFVGHNDETANYHIDQALIALGSGGAFGLGLGKNVQAFGYLPEAPNDSIFAVMGESFGFIGSVAILVFIAALLLRLLNIVDRTEDATMRLIVAGVFGWLATHTILNIGAMVGVIPLTGITLPLLSFGGTSLLFIMLALGIVFSISRYTVHGKISEDETQQKSPHGGRWIGRSRYTTASRR